MLKARGVTVFKLRCNGESYGWTARLIHPEIYHTALEAQIALDKDKEYTSVHQLNLMAVGIGIEEKDKLIEKISKYINASGDVKLNALGYVLLNRWDEYWDIV